MSAGTDKLREWAASDREQAECHRWFAATATDEVHAADEEAKAAADDAEANGWDAIASAADVASGEVVDPEA